MSTRTIPSVIALLLLMGCLSTPREDYFLDPAIPRIETDTNKIAYIRTEWSNDRHVGTAFLDSQNRVLELFKFGRYCFKTVQRYKGANNTMTINYSHSDSSPMGYADVDTLRRTYDATGRLKVKGKTFGGISRDERYLRKVGYHTLYLDYTAQGDTIVTKEERSDKDAGTNLLANINKWEWDRQKHLRQHYHLYVGWSRDDPRDTLYHYSERYAYDSLGRLALSWFEPIYRARYLAGSGTKVIWYRYDDQNRLVEKRYYTSNMSHVFKKARPDLNAPDRKKEDWYRKNYFVADSALLNNKDFYSVKYQYEKFDPKKHLPLKIPVVD